MIIKPLEWTDRFFLLGKAIRLADRPEYETTVAGFSDDNKTVTLHHGNAQTMDGFAANYEVFFPDKWVPIQLKQFKIQFRSFFDGDYFRPACDIPTEYFGVYALDKGDATSKFFKHFEEIKARFEVQNVEEIS